jgi:hypothetical protein
MNYVQADNGNMVLAEGAPASMARVRVQFPVLIDKLRELSRKGASADDVHFVFASHNITSRLERESLLMVASFSPVVHPLEFHL